MELACDDSLGSRIREARRRRVAVVAVVGAREAAAASAQVTDIAAGFRDVVAVDRLVERVVAARDGRCQQVDWARAGIRQGARAL